jgi:hypothetical protein
LDSASPEPISARQNTRSEGAEFLVLGNLLIDGIPAYKTYTNMRGYDIVATDPERGSAARIQVKSRWRTNAEGFIINNFECDFVVAAMLNRGSEKTATTFLRLSGRGDSVSAALAVGQIGFRQDSRA